VCVREDDAEASEDQEPQMLMFFKAIYREPILRGEKTDTIRPFSKRLPKPGQIVQACVGPSRIFARLRILAVQPIAELPPARRAQLVECYGVVPPDALRLQFEIVQA
jgi:hypothetical protein